MYKEYNAEYVFYYDDPKGKHRTVYGTPVNMFRTKNGKEFQKELRIYSHKKLWESDINPVFRCLENNYLGATSPKLQTAFFDIEVDFDPERGFSPPEDPFNAITAISIYLDWMDKIFTLVLPPKTYSWETAQEICNKYENTFLFEREEDLFKSFLDIIEDADILSGWNSEGFDIPYTVRRMTRVLSKDDTRRLCLWEQFPKERIFERFGAEQITYDLVGRVHMDYMQLYRKYTYEERHSYSLDAISEYELGERKTQYEGTLDQLYNKDFPTFIEYNRQDTMLLARMDKKLRFLDLANELAHDNTVLLQTTMGAVAVTEQAIINEAHQRGLIVPNKKRSEEHGDTQAAGAYVAFPKKGMHDWIGAIDINSLYPSAIRALNMAQESIIGQLRPIMTDRYIQEKMTAGSSFADAWENMFGSIEYTAVMNGEVNTEITIDWEADGSSTVMTAADIWRLIFEGKRPWMLSANGTIFSYESKAVVPGLLERWYAERKELQAKKKDAETEEDKAFWDKRQLVKKINLNSLYGAILNPHCRFFDKRIGQSTTLTGRIIARHMDAYINECILGTYDHTGESIIYGDTDSCYFTAWPAVRAEVEAGRMEWNKEICSQLYDSIADQVNDSFPSFMERACNVPREMGSLIKGGRELVASKGLFIKKKRYAVLIYDLEGKRLDTHGKPGKVKAMGLDLKRADTPKVVQDFLSDLLLDVLTGAEKEAVYEKVKAFKLEFKERPAWEKGTPKRVNNLTKYSKEEERLGKANMPGHVRAAMNWNRLRRMHGDNYSISIVDGMKTIVCKLKDNPIGYTSVGYPIDESHLPEWFKELPFDNDAMEGAIVNQKVENLLGVLAWDIPSYTDIKTTFDTLFSFE
ncbi:PolB DNA polymerase elongation subunit (family B) [uncultured Caudovirales phage]|uniref:DNA-directed DNA polymerase n=1 Tax=uncultured Caudovirales phage TaxID=2100421 RepID=A0A6J5LPH2_9CAUD|nr:PolB DNA polymerase elongation subunit (family B) [uncultured Caudovirales phage]